MFDGCSRLELPPELHPSTQRLVVNFASALAAKLRAAEEKYGYADFWSAPGWVEECRTKLREHLEKGDPRDVAAYCAFLWYHGESTVSLAGAEPRSGRDASERKLMSGEMVATCIGCGCTDLHACAGGCTWIQVDYGMGLGVCSKCAAHSERWLAGDLNLTSEAKQARAIEDEVRRDLSDEVEGFLLGRLHLRGDRAHELAWELAVFLSSRLSRHYTVRCEP